MEGFYLPFLVFIAKDSSNSNKITYLYVKYIDIAYSWLKEVPAYLSLTTKADAEPLNFLTYF